MRLVEEMLRLVKKYKAELSDEDVIEICVDNDFNPTEILDILKRYDQRGAPVEDEWKEVRSASDVSAQRRREYNNKEQYRFQREVEAEREAARRNYEE